MGLKDLNIEFEDESEKDKSNAVEQGVELNFAANSDKAKSAKVLEHPSKNTRGPELNGAEAVDAVIRSLTFALKDCEKEKHDYMIEVVSEAKLFDHKMNAVINKMAKANPEAKQDLLMIKKLVADFIKVVKDN